MRFVVLFFLLSAAAMAQSYNPGLPVAGLPVSVGAKTKAGSTSITLATDQGAISVTGATANNSSVGPNYTTAPSDSTQIGGVTPGGSLTPLVIGDSGITVSASQATSPWVISGGVAITTTPTVNQGTSPWVTSVPDGVGITNTPTVNQGTNPWVVSVPAGVAITNTPTVNQGTSPWITSVPNGVGITNTVTTTVPTASSTTITRVANAVTNKTLLSSNTSRKGVFLYNDDSAANCYVKFGVTASTTDFTIKMFPTDTYIMDSPTYTGQIDYICDSATGSMEISEQ